MMKTKACLIAAALAVACYQGISADTLAVKDSLDSSSQIISEQPKDSADTFIQVNEKQNTEDTLMRVKEEMKTEDTMTPAAEGVKAEEKAQNIPESVDSICYKKGDTLELKIMIDGNMKDTFYEAKSEGKRCQPTGYLEKLIAEKLKLIPEELKITGVVKCIAKQAEKKKENIAEEQLYDTTNKAAVQKSKIYKIDMRNRIDRKKSEVCFKRGDSLSMDIEINGGEEQRFYVFRANGCMHVDSIERKIAEFWKMRPEHIRVNREIKIDDEFMYGFNKLPSIIEKTDAESLEVYFITKDGDEGPYRIDWDYSYMVGNVNVVKFVRK
jgi:hypothetical protein